MNTDDILKIAAEGERIKNNSAEALWILHGVVPPKLPDVVSTTAELNPLRRPTVIGGEVSRGPPMQRPGETRLDFSAALPPAGKRP
jgi:hypothetical protein